MKVIFSENSHCDLDLGPRTLKLIIVQDIVILHICGKLNQNRSMNEGSRAMTMFFSKNSHRDLDLGIALLFVKPGRVAQSVGHLTRKSGVLSSIPGLATYFRFSFRFFKKGSCQLLAKVCARSTG